MKKILVGTMTLLMLSTASLAGDGERTGISDKKTKEKILLRCAHETNGGEQCREFDVYLQKLGHERQLNGVPIRVADLSERKVTVKGELKAWPKRKTSKSLFGTTSSIFNALGYAAGGLASDLGPGAIWVVPPVATAMAVAGASVATAGGVVWVGEQGLNLVRLPVLPFKNAKRKKDVEFNSALQALAGADSQEISHRNFKKVRKLFEGFSDESTSELSAAISNRQDKLSLASEQVQLASTQSGSASTKSAQ